MNIQVNDAGIIINRMGHPLDARKVCESYNELLAALKKAADDLDAVAFQSNYGIAAGIRAAIAKATQS